LEVDVLDAEDESEQSGKVEENFQNKLSSTEFRRMQSEKARSKSKV